MPYKPSFAQIRTAPKPLDEREIKVPFPEVRTASEIINSAERPPREARQQIPARQTELRFSGQLAGSKILEHPPLKPDFTGVDLASSPVLQKADFLVGVSADGQVLYTFLQESSGNEALDRQAEQNLSTIKFDSRAQYDIIWGKATYYWGADAYPPAPPKK